MGLLETDDAQMVGEEKMSYDLDLLKEFDYFRIVFTKREPNKYFVKGYIEYPEGIHEQILFEGITLSEASNELKKIRSLLDEDKR